MASKLDEIKKQKYMNLKRAKLGLKPKVIKLTKEQIETLEGRAELDKMSKKKREKVLEELNKKYKTNY